jgi:hypothetical protein
LADCNDTSCSADCPPQRNAAFTFLSIPFTITHFADNHKKPRIPRARYPGNTGHGHAAAAVPEPPHTSSRAFYRHKVFVFPRRYDVIRSEKK